MPQRGGRSAVGGRARGNDDVEVAQVGLQKVEQRAHVLRRTGASACRLDGILIDEAERRKVLRRGAQRIRDICHAAVDSRENECAVVPTPVRGGTRAHSIWRDFEQLLTTRRCHRPTRANELLKYSVEAIHFCHI